jgi:hypothetical protein
LFAVTRTVLDIFHLSGSMFWKVAAVDRPGSG